MNIYMSQSRHIVKCAILLCSVISSLGCGAARSQKHHREMAAASPAQAQKEGTAQVSGQWVIEGQIHLAVDELEPTTRGLKQELEGHGYIVSEVRAGGRGSMTSQLILKIDPRHLSPFVDWLKSRGETTFERISREEVSRRVLATELELTNAQETLKRIQRFLASDQLKVEEVLKIESELERLRTKIGRLEGERDLLKRQIAHATLHLEITEFQEVQIKPEAKLLLSARPLLAYSSGQAQELGWGASLSIPTSPASFHIDWDYLPDSKRGILTLGTGVYSEYFGNGKRGFLNPYLGLKFGAIFETRAFFTAGATAGIELFRGEFGMINLKGEALGIFSKSGVDSLYLSGLDLAIAF